MSVAQENPHAQWKAEVEIPVYTLSDVEKHKAKGDAWMVIHGKVYNVTKYIDDHPGGADVLLETAGTDATAEFEDNGHSDDAREILNSFLVGQLPEGESNASSAETTVRVIHKVVDKNVEEQYSMNSKYYTSVAVGACLILAVRFTVRKEHLPHMLSAHFASSAQGNNFLNGVLAATTIFATVGAFAFKHLKKAAKISTNFLNYPPHIRSAIPAPVHQVVGFLVPRDYKKLLLIKKENISPNVILFTFQLPTPSTVLGLPIGQHVSIRGHVDDQVVSRSYTPTSNNRDLGILELVIKIYDDGLLTGKYLSKLQIGDLVEFRGPKGSMRYRRGWSKEIGMIAGGTGITPMFQLIRGICEDDKDLTQVSLIYANRAEGDILLRKELDRFATLYPQNFRLWYVLDSPSPQWQFGKGYITKAMIAEKLPSPSKHAKILLCGPPGMINASKKSLAKLGFETPSAVSKMSDQVFCF